MDWRRGTLGTEKPIRRPLQYPRVRVQRSWIWVLALEAEKRGRIQRKSSRMQAKCGSDRHMVEGIVKFVT